MALMPSRVASGTCRLLGPCSRFKCYIHRASNFVFCSNLLSFLTQYVSHRIKAFKYYMLIASGPKAQVYQTRPHRGGAPPREAGNETRATPS